jgi:diacylglycerol kinase (ATP)
MDSLAADAGRILERAISMVSSKNKHLIIVASSAAGASDFDWLAAKANESAAEVAIVTSAADAAKRWSSSSLVVAAGGDGSIGHVVQELMQAPEPRPTLGILPMGTGNDLARSLDIPLDHDAAWSLLFSDSRRPLDLVRMETDEDPPWWISNIAVVGPPLAVYDAADRANKSWGPLGYVAAALAALDGLDPFDVESEVTGGAFFNIPGVTHLVVANGRSMGGGVPVAPDAVLDDGAADFIFIAAEGLVSAGVIGVSALLGAHLDDPRVCGVCARGASFVFSRPVGVQCDGHEWTTRTARFLTHPAALSVISPDAAAQTESGTAPVVAIAGASGDLAVVASEVSRSNRERP